MTEPDPGRLFIQTHDKLASTGALIDCGSGEPGQRRMTSRCSPWLAAHSFPTLLRAPPWVHTAVLAPIPETLTCNLLLLADEIRRLCQSAVSSRKTFDFMTFLSFELILRFFLKEQAASWCFTDQFEDQSW